ncbi:MAG: hypothetical protein H7175_15465, partial [Burkholderiales bacterium]|nr:hypothetical protein [Anaerolineae bacterium]
MRKITLLGLMVLALPAAAQTPTSVPTPISPLMAYVEVVTLNVRNAP